MTTDKSRFEALLLLVIFMGGCAMQATDGATGIEGVFDRMEQALRNKDEELFKSQWHPEGYTINLVGGSGLAGAAVFSQGSRKGWYLKPDFAKQEKLESVFIIPCQIWSWEREKAVDEVHAAVVSHDQKLVVLGAGEEPEQVKALAQRFLSGAPLAPSK